MADKLKRAAAWLGLVTDDRYADYDDHESQDELTENVHRDELVLARHGGEGGAGSVTQLEARRPTGQAPAAAGPRPADLSRIITVHPRTYNEARVIGEHFREGVPVIMNLTDMEDRDAKRLVDFAAGLIFGLHGTIERVTSKVFLLSPHNVNVTAEDKERIVGGFFNQS